MLYGMPIQDKKKDDDYLPNPGEFDPRKDYKKDVPEISDVIDDILDIVEKDPLADRYRQPGGQ